MTESDFFARALLSIAGSGVFGKPNFHYMKEWAKDVEQAAAVLTDVADESHCLEADEPNPKYKPP